MKNNQTIRSLISLFFLCLFTFCITPKKVLHNWIANHKDQTHFKNNLQNKSVGNAGYHCNTDNLVAESPFESNNIHLPGKVAAVFSDNNNAPTTRLYSVLRLFIPLRGPPVYDIFTLHV